MSPPKERLPFAPFVRRFENQKDMARELGIPLRTVQRWAKQGIPADRADELAIASGAHPSEIWDSWFS